jgi:DNA-binding transcriptional ArsR family regulator
MPIALKDLRGRREEPVRDGSVASRALALLRSRMGVAWRPVEIAEELDVDQRTVSPALTRLRRRGLIEREKGHWYALEDREVAKRAATLVANRGANAKWGKENPADWPEARRD